MAEFELQPGQTFGPYTVESTLGVGGMGRVFKATGPDGTVALKLVKEDIARDPTFRKRFDREASIAQRVVHDHLVPVLDKGEVQGIPYLTQQFVDGGSLADLLERDSRLAPADALGVLEQVAGALDALHAQGLFHRDIKPANILIDAGGDAYLTDFGLAKDSQGSLLTRPGQTVGSLDYMAPEQIHGAEVTAQMDVYALACVAYECLTGDPPFADRQGMRVLWAHLQDEPVNPSEKAPEVPHALGEAVLTGLAKDAGDRPASASGYVSGLRAAAGG
jgi:serine/threonine protein kinase